VVGAPIFVAGWGGLGLIALTHGGTQAGAFLCSVALIIAVITAFQPYSATVRPDGSLTFKALLRTITTTLDSVYRISIVRGRGRSYVFHFNGQKASLGMFGGRDLALYLVERDPTIDHPKL
jgi:hypothetical protein